MNTGLRRVRAMSIAATLFVVAALTSAPCAFATTYVLTEGSDLVGQYREVSAARGDTMLDLARRHGFGYEEMVAANPDVDPWLPGEGTVVRLPALRVLPDAPREGIVVNLPEHRLYYFLPARAGEPRRVVTFPVSVGRMDWSTPLGLTRVTAKAKNPPWHPPESIRREHARRGNILPRVVPPGPDNPLGSHVLRLAIPTGAYLIHGTNNPDGVGMQVTSGCLRLFPEHIAELYEMVPLNTPVRIVNQPHKTGWADGRLYVEVHKPLEQTDTTVVAPDRTSLARLVANAVRARPAPVAWQYAEQAFDRAEGIPVAVTLAEPTAVLGAR